MPDVRIKAVCDLVKDKAKKVADTYGISRVYTDYRRMLDKETFLTRCTLSCRHTTDSTFCTTASRVVSTRFRRNRPL